MSSCKFSNSILAFYWRSALGRINLFDLKKTKDCYSFGLWNRLKISLFESYQEELIMKNNNKFLSKKEKQNQKEEKKKKRRLNRSRNLVSILQ